MLLDAIMNAGNDPPWGYRLCEETGLGSGTVYPILERLEEAGWIEGAWEAGRPADRPRRRFYLITAAGRAGKASAPARRRGGARVLAPEPGGGHA